MTQDENYHQHNIFAEDQHIIVIGASAGGFEAFKTIIANLPPDFQPPIFIVWHMSPDIKGVLPSVLNKMNSIYAAHALSGETIVPNRIYVAPPDHHLLIENGQVRLTKGPKENHFRPAVDPLFRSAAYMYGNRVVGVVLSGGLDDGTAGLWRIKYSGGTTIVQDPDTAEVRSMPANALREVDVDYCAPVEEIASLLVQISNTPPHKNNDTIKDEKTKIEIGIAAGDSEQNMGSLKIGELSPLTCPECNGVLSKITEGTLTRFRCHTGHAFSVDTLLSLITEKTEESLYNALSGIEETMMLLNHIGDHLAEINNSSLAAVYFTKAQEAHERADILRKNIMGNEHLSNERLLRDKDNLEN